MVFARKILRTLDVDVWLSASEKTRSLPPLDVSTRLLVWIWRGRGNRIDLARLVSKSPQFVVVRKFDITAIVH